MSSLCLTFFAVHMNYNEVRTVLGGEKRSIYIDVYFFYNGLMDILLLLVTAGIMRQKVTFLRLLLGASFAAVMAVIIILCPPNPLIRVGVSLMQYTLVPIGMVYLAFGKMARKQRKRMIFVLYGVAFGCGGIVQMVAGHTMLGYQLMAIYVSNRKLYLSLGGIVAVSFYTIRLLEVRKAYADGLCRVEVTIQGQRYPLMGLIDTGNRLKDPIYGNAVHVINQSCVKGCSANVHYIPYHSVGTENGIIPVIFADAMVIERNGERKKLEKPEIALYEGEVSSDREYDILLNSEILR